MRVGNSSRVSEFEGLLLPAREVVHVAVELVGGVGVVVAEQVSLSLDVGVVAVARPADLPFIARVHTNREVLYDPNDDLAGAEKLSSKGQNGAGTASESLEDRQVFEDEGVPFECALVG